MERNIYRIVVCIALFSLLAWPIMLVESNPDGAPVAACADMSATPHGGSSSNNPLQYELVFSQTEISSSDTLSLNVSQLTGMTNVFYKGFMVMAFKEGDESTPLGSFQTPDDEAKTIDCPGGTNSQNAVTHSNNSVKYSVEVVWVPPADFVGNVIFKATYLRSLYNYWERKPSSTIIKVVAGDPSVTTTTSSSSTGNNAQSTSTVVSGSSTTQPSGSSTTQPSGSSTTQPSGSSTTPPPTSRATGTAMTTNKQSTASSMSTEKTTSQTTVTSSPGGGASGLEAGWFLTTTATIAIIVQLLI